MIWISYTTRYRTGSDKFARAAETMRQELAAKHPGVEVRLEPLVRKGDFVAALGADRRRGEAARRAPLPRSLGDVRDHVRLGRLARAVQPARVAAAAHPVRARRPRLLPRLPHRAVVRAVLRAHLRRPRARAPRLHDGLDLARSVHLGAAAPRAARGRCTSSPARERSRTGCRARSPSTSARAPCPWRRTRPRRPAATPRYDAVAALYDRAFADIRVRRDEWRWLNARLDRAAFPGGRPRVLDIGCGTGALLRALAGRIATGVGVDTSAKMIAQAAARSQGSEQLRFQKIDGPALPFADRLVRPGDVVPVVPLPRLGSDHARDPPGAGAGRPPDDRRHGRARARLARRRARWPRRRPSTSCGRCAIASSCATSPR